MMFSSRGYIFQTVYFNVYSIAMPCLLDLTVITVFGHKCITFSFFQHAHNAFMIKECTFWTLYKWLHAFRSMRTKSTISVWTRTAWCTRPSLWPSHVPTLFGRNSVWGCTAPSQDGLNHVSCGELVCTNKYTYTNTHAYGHLCTVYSRWLQ